MSQCASVAQAPAALLPTGFRLLAQRARHVLLPCPVCYYLRPSQPASYIFFRVTYCLASQMRLVLQAHDGPTRPVYLLACMSWGLGGHLTALIRSITSHFRGIQVQYTHAPACSPCFMRFGHISASRLSPRGATHL